MKQFFREKYSWKVFTVISKNGVKMVVGEGYNILKSHKYLLDLSSVQLDGTHTYKEGGRISGLYQGRKKSKTTNTLILTASQGIPLACNNPIAGNHNNAFNLVKTFQKMIGKVQSATIPVKGLFLNTDSGFDTYDFRTYCYVNKIFDNIGHNKRTGNSCESNTVFDGLLYKTRFVIERTNAWLDAFKAVLVRFETIIYTGKACYYWLFKWFYCGNFKQRQC